MSEKDPFANFDTSGLELVPIDPQQTEGGQEVSLAEVEASQERLNGNMERLKENLAQLDTLSPEVVASPEGQEATESFLGNISSRLKNFGSGIKERVMSGVASLDNGDRVAKVLGTVAGVGILAPVMMQFVRSRWPEAGVAMDMMPDALQQLAHLDLASRVSELFGGAHAWVWDTGNVDGMNLLADVASGKMDFANLAEEQVSLLQQTLPPDAMSTMEHFAKNPTGGIDAQYIAENQAHLAAGASTFGNMAFLGAPALAIGGALHKVGQFARKSLSK